MGILGFFTKQELLYGLGFLEASLHKKLEENGIREEENEAVALEKFGVPFSG